MKTLQIVFLLFCCEYGQAQTWSQVGLGADQSPYCFLEDTISHLWYVGGSFTNLNGQPVNRIGVSTNGYTFTQVGAGFNGPVYALVFYNGELYAGGNFTMSGATPVNYIAKWDGATWQTVGGGSNFLVTAMAVYQSELCAGGQFGNASGVLNTKGIAKWNGAVWSTVGGGTSGFSINLQALEVYNNELYAGGNFTNMGGTPADGLAKWNGSTWTAIGCGGGQVFDFEVYNNKLFTVGNIPSIGGNSMYHLCFYDGANWVSVGSTGFPYCLTKFNGILYVGGAFTAISLPAEKVAYLNGAVWSQVGMGFDDNVNVLGSFNGHLYAGGSFHFSGTTPIEHFAIWDDTSLPVELCSFTCVYTDSIVSLRWVTLSEINSGHFVVSISLDGISYTDMFSVPAVGNTTTTHTYSFDDHSPPPGTAYYKLTEFDFGGRVAGVWNCVSVVPPQIRMMYHSTTQLLECGGCDDSVTIYNADGEIIREGPLPMRVNSLSRGVYSAYSPRAQKSVRFVVIGN